MPATAYYVNPGNSPFFEKHINIAGAGVTEYRHFIGGIAVYTQYSNASPATTKYMLKDHLGSTTVVTSSAGVVLERYSYDPFGRTRNLNGSDIPQSTTMTAPSTRRGFTDHEMLTEYIGGLIHMALGQPLNGRIFDPSLGRFMTADPNIQFAGYSQSYNRYSYTLNNPLSYTDPTGYGLRAFFNAIDDKARHPGNIEKLYNVIRQRPNGGAHDRFMMNNSLARTAGHIAAGFIPYVGFVVQAGISGYEVWLQGGTHADIERAWMVSLGTSAAFYEVGEASSAVGGFWGAVIKVGGSTAIGCASADASGGSCRQGALFSGGLAAADVLYQYAEIKTDGLKQTACDAGKSVCQWNEWGERRTDGGRETDWTNNPEQEGNWLTESGMAREASGKHIYDPDGVLANRYLARAVNHVSKIHDFFNSWNYSSGGLYMSRGVVLDSLFQIYSFAGMPVAGALTAAHYIGGNPTLLAGQLEARKRRNSHE